MTFARMLIAGWLTSEFVRNSDGAARLVVIAIAAAVWWLVTTDPLPAAIERGLERYRERYLR